MNLTQEQAHRLASMIKPSTVLEYINNNLSDYEKWLEEEVKNNQMKMEEYDYEIKILKIKGKQSSND
ncbi:MAG: hypothetical protein PHF30_01620 [Bacilli bacterium]|nr:hypothetical protein [Bacilli bacterium]